MAVLSKNVKPRWRSTMLPNGLTLPRGKNRSPYINTPKLVKDSIRETYKTSSNTSRLKKFHEFPDLPTELRLKIWEQCLQPRVVDITYSEEPNTCRTSCPVPVLLHVNREARYIALEHYSLVFGPHGQDPTIYFDFQRDTLYFGAGNLSSDMAHRCFLDFETDEIGKVQKLATDVELDLFHHLIDSEDFQQPPTTIAINESDDDDESVREEDNLVVDEATNMDWEHVGSDVCALSAKLGGLKSITVVTKTGQEDVHLVGISEQSNEVQAWNITEFGAAENWLRTTRSIHSCRPAISQASRIDWEVLLTWRYLETSKLELFTKKGCTFRFVSLDRLSRLDEWKDRRVRLRGKTHVNRLGCTLSSSLGHHLLEFLELLQQKYISAHHELHRILRKYLPAPARYKLLQWVVAGLYGGKCLCRHETHPWDTVLDEWDDTAKKQTKAIFELLAEVMRLMFRRSRLTPQKLWNQKPELRELMLDLLSWAQQENHFEKVGKAMEWPGKGAKIDAKLGSDRVLRSRSKSLG